MKPYLLDTHIWIWSLIEPKRLSSQIRHILEDEKSELFLSPVSVWEALLLCERNKISVNLTPSKWVRNALANSPLQEAPMNIEIAIVSRELALNYKDPADRFILATARVFKFTLITADEVLWKVKDVPSLRA